ncbi:hypothetical protein AHAS_Ahas07G0076600 [Arachis hypogaea]
MKFISSFDQINFMENYPPLQHDSSHYHNGGWEYQQKMTDYEQSTQWGYALEPQNNEANHLRYCPEPQNDLCHYPHGVWEYQQKCEQSSEKGYFPPPQCDLCHDPNGGWEY